MNSNVKKSMFLIIVVVIAVLFMYSEQMNSMKAIVDSRNNVSEQYVYTENDNTFKIISSTENADLETMLEKFALNNNIDLDIEYAGTIEIMEKLNNGEEYDAVWTSNSIWMYMLDSNTVTTSDSKSTSINPVVFGITKSKAEELELIGKELYTKDIVNLIKERKIKV